MRPRWLAVAVWLVPELAGAWSHHHLQHQQRVVPRLGKRGTTREGGRAAVALGAAAVTADELPPPPRREPRPGWLSLSIKGKSVNLWGCVFGLSMTAWVIGLYPLVLACAGVSYAFDKSKRRLMDAIVAFWAKVSMLSCGYKPRVSGLENLPEKGEAVLYVPNHTSYLDILTLSGFLGRPFKYISKIEILRIPLIGWAMGFAGHVALKRSDRRSQLETYKAAVKALKDGNSITAFPEGTRSKTGTLQSFKRGPFKMAIDAGVDVVPVAVCDLHKWHPTSALMPLGRPTDVEVKILPRIHTAGAKPDDLLQLAFAAVNDALPDHQKRIEDTTTPAS